MKFDFANNMIIVRSHRVQNSSKEKNSQFQTGSKIGTAQPQLVTILEKNTDNIFFRTVADENLSSYINKISFYPKTCRPYDKGDLLFDPALC